MKSVTILLIEKGETFLHELFSRLIQLSPHLRNDHQFSPISLFPLYSPYFCPGHTAGLCFCQLPLNKTQQLFWCTITFYSYVWTLWYKIGNSKRIEHVQVSDSWGNFTVLRRVRDPVVGAMITQILWLKQPLLLSPFIGFQDRTCCLPVLSLCVFRSPFPLSMSSFHLLSTRSALSPTLSFLFPTSFSPIW